MSNRIRIVLTIPEDFAEKFTNFVNNINALNNDKNTPIIIERVNKIEKPKYAAVPKNKKEDG